MIGPPASTHPARSVLLVERDDTEARTLRAALEAAGYVVTVVSSAEEAAVAQCAAGPFVRVLTSAPADAAGTAAARHHEVAARLVASERLASIGAVAAGVASEVNNPLASVLANVESAQEQLAAALIALAAARDAAPDAPAMDALALALRDAQEALGDARRGGERVRLLVRDLKTLASPDAATPRRPADVRRALDAALHMVLHEVRYRARVVRDYGPAPAVDASEAQLGQVFLNVLRNAAASIPEGDLEAHEVRVSTRTDARGRAVVEVRDTGAGLSAERLAGIFEPFGAGGAGVGLAVCRAILEPLGGEIALESAPGRGTLVRVVLPAAAPRANVAARRSSRPSPGARRGRVLVVDDEALVGVTIERVLAAEHTVVRTTCPRDALAILERGERFDVLLCDAGVAGTDLRDEIARRAPEQARRVVFITGSGCPLRARPRTGEGPPATLEKPFDPRSLRALVRSLVR